MESHEGFGTEVRPGNYQSAARESLIRIFDEFCTPKHRAYGRIENLSIANPSDYCCEHLSLEPRQTTGRRAVFVAASARRGLASKFVYVLLKQNGRWLVDNKKVINDDGSETSWWL